MAKRNIQIDNIIFLSKFNLDNKNNYKDGKDSFNLEHRVDIFGDLPHKRNSLGLVGEEIDPDAEVLALGCSVTSSLGIPHQLTWPYLIKKHLDKSINVLAGTGLGIPEILDLLIGYFRSSSVCFPKYIYILFPDLFRTNFIDIHTMNLTQLDYNSEVGFLIENKKVPKVKETYLKKYTPSVEYTVLSYLRQIGLLISFCKSIGIHTVISSWDMYSQKVFDELGYLGELDSTGCFSSEERYWSFERECNKHNFSVPDHLKYFWDLGIDTEGHPGLHHHIHYAESLLGEDIDYEMLQDLTYDSRWIEFVENK